MRLDLFDIYKDYHCKDYFNLKILFFTTYILKTRFYFRQLEKNILLHICRLVSGNFTFNFNIWKGF